MCRRWLALFLRKLATVPDSNEIIQLVIVYNEEDASFCQSTVEQPVAEFE